MKVRVHLKTQSQPVVHDGVRNTYQKGSFYCVMMHASEVHKYPVADIFRVTETGEPEPVP